MPQEPKRITVRSDADYLSVLSQAVFQSGISWRVVEAKWPGTVEAFKGFDPTKVANLTPNQVDALTEDTRLIRNRRKIEATVDNAETMLALAKEHGTFKKYLRSFPSYDDLQTDLVKRFKFVGPLGAYWFLYVVKEKVPSHAEWSSIYR
jgi:3-methyladenine DNA glycosylase Tag